MWNLNLKKNKFCFTESFRVGRLPARHPNSTRMEISNTQTMGVIGTEHSRIKRSKERTTIDK